MLPKRIEFIRQSVSVVAAISLAPFRSCCPKRMDEMVAPPADTNVQNATTRFISGKVMARPAIPMAPTP